MKRASTNSDMLPAVQAAVDEQHLLPDSGAVVVGVSGGPDSVCLLHILTRLCGPGGPFAGVGLHVAHLDHGLRGEAGRADADFVAHLAEAWGLPATIAQADVLALARAEHRSLEDAARRARYTFLRRVAIEIQAARIAVGHHADDQVETLIMHWLRGSGLTGLAGMRPLEGVGVPVIRPLLPVSRAEILEYCAAHGLTYREDASNQDRRFLRNRIRHDLLPVLERYNPNLRETLLRNAAVLAEDDAYLQSQLDACWAGVITREEGGCVEGDVEAYRRLPLALRRRLLLHSALRASGGETHLELRHVEAGDALLLRRAGAGQAYFPGGLRLRRVYGRFVILSEIHAIEQAKRQARQARPGSPLSESGAQSVAMAPLPVPGEAQVPGTHWLVRSHLLEGAANPPPGYERGKMGQQWGYMDLDAVTAYLPLAVRTRRAGDRFQPLGLQRAKKLQDTLVDAKIPRSERETLPLVCGADGTILWVAGYQIADLVKLTPTTRCALALELEAIDEH